MTHLNFSVEQHGGIYILQSGNVSTFFSSSNIEKIQKSVTYFHNTCTRAQKYATHFLETNGRASALEHNSTALQPVFFS